MDEKRNLVVGFMIAVTFLVGCSTAPGSRSDQVGTDRDATRDSRETAETASETPPEGSRFVCHLACSEEEAKAYGATEAEARASVQELVTTLCKPEDGQHFIFCDPLE